MSDGRSRADLLSFLDFLGQKGLIPPSTASARKASANKVLAILSEDEAVEAVLRAQLEPTLRGDLRDLMKKLN